MISMNTIPYERSILSTIMYDITKFSVLIGVLTPDHFFDDTCKELYSHAQSAYFQKEPFSDFVAISKMPNRQNEIALIAAELPVSAETLSVQADIIIRAAANRKLLKSVEKMRQDLIDGKDVNIDDLKQENIVTNSSFRTNSEIIRAMETRIHDPSEDFGTGISELDEFLNLEPGNMIIIAARPSMGKTGFVTSTIWHLLKKREGSIFYSLEMSSEGIMMRLLANESGETMNDIRHNRLKSRDAYANAKKFLEENSNNFMLIDNSMNEIEIYNTTVNQIRKNPAIKNIFVDHLTYVADSGGHKSKHLQIDAITKTMKRLAKDTGAKVWVLSQLSRGVESRPNKRPQLSDMRESGSIEEDADVIIGLYRDSYYSAREEGAKEAPVNEIELIVLKNRDGEVGTARSYFIGPNVKISDNPPYGGAVEVHEYEYVEDDIPSVEVPMI